MPSGPARLLAVLGTRPEVIKLAPVLRTLRESPADFEVEVCAVRQHSDLLERALVEWGLAPDLAIDLPGRRGALCDTLAAMLPRLERCIRRSRPAGVLVQGDTTTALGGALAAFHAGVPVCHVEAGLRTGDLRRPYPEEMNRVLIDRLATVLYAPTELARRNLLAEGFPESAVVLAGNTVVDALTLMGPRRQARPTPRGRARRMLLVTCHRRESFSGGSRRVCLAVKELLRLRPDVEVVYILHSNPAASSPPRAVLNGTPRLRLLPPAGYRDFLRLLSRCFLVISDSGGIQEEAPYLRKPVLVTREATERPEAVELGLACLVGTDVRTIVARAMELLEDRAAYARMTRPARPFGDGAASRRICADLRRRFVPAR